VLHTAKIRSSTGKSGFILVDDYIDEFHSLAMDLLAMHRNLFGRNDSELDAIALNGNNFHSNNVVDYDFFADSARQDKHD
jgi:hypothetical protein